MGNCVVKGAAITYTDPTSNNFIRIISVSGDVIELQGPKLVSEFLHNFPNHNIYSRQDMSSPLPDHEHLLPGQSYYLFPFPTKSAVKGSEDEKIEPVRVSSATLEVLQAPQKGVWKVKLVITSKQLEEILAEDVYTEALIEQIRMASVAGHVATHKRMKKGRELGWRAVVNRIFKLQNIVHDDDDDDGRRREGSPESFSGGKS